MSPVPARAELAGSFPEYQPIFIGLFPLQLPSHPWCSHLPEPHYLVDDQPALEDGQEVPGLLAHCHSHLHGLVPVFLVQLDGIEGTGSDFIHGGVAALGDREVTQCDQSKGKKLLHNSALANPKACNIMRLELKLPDI